jgi:ArsR family transcriptional regulator
MARLVDPEVQLLAALADPSRLEIVRQIAQAGGPMFATDFADCCGVSQPTVSHHLKALRAAGWIVGTREGTRIAYAIEPAALERYRAIGKAIGA